jgi:hypothetical protein
MSRKEEAEALFRGGFNCAQSLLAAYGAGLGIEREAALRRLAHRPFPEPRTLTFGEPPALDNIIASGRIA